MGYNSAILIHNDAMGCLDDQQVLQTWWQNMHSAIQSRNLIDVSIAYNANGSSLFHMDHADYTGIYAIGGNYTTQLGSRLGYSHHTQENKLEILKELAKDMGYRLVKQTNR